MGDWDQFELGKWKCCLVFFFLGWRFSESNNWRPNNVYGASAGNNHKSRLTQESNQSYNQHLLQSHSTFQSVATQHFNQSTILVLQIEWMSSQLRMKAGTVKCRRLWPARINFPFRGSKFHSNADKSSPGCRQSVAFLCEINQRKLTFLLIFYDIKSHFREPETGSTTMVVGFPQYVSVIVNPRRSVDLLSALAYRNQKNKYIFYNTAIRD